MTPFMFRSKQSRLLITLATVCAILLLGIASPAPALDRGAVSFQNGKVPVSSAVAGSALRSKRHPRNPNSRVCPRGTNHCRNKY